MATYWETAPLPTWLGWYAHQLPMWAQRLMSALTLVVELGVPLLIWGPRRFRPLVFALMAAFQLGVLATANYGFFNYLSLALCLWVLDDGHLAWLAARAGVTLRPEAVGAPRPATTAALGIATAVLVPLSLVPFLPLVPSLRPLARALLPARAVLDEVRSINAYHLFAQMTLVRREAVIEGLGRRRRLARLRAALPAGRRRPRAAVRRAAPAARRLPDVVPSPWQPRTPAVVPGAARPRAARPVGGGAALLPQPLPGHAAALRPRRRLPLSLHRRRHARADGRLVDARTGGRHATDRGLMPRRGPVPWIAPSAGPGVPSQAMGEPAPTTSPLLRRYTLEEFWELEPPPGGGHYELIGGVLYMVPPPDWSHGIASSNLNRLLVTYELAHLGTCRVIIPRAGIQKTPHTWVEPDLMLVTAERVARTGRYLEGADLVVEVSGARSAVYDRTTKADTYAALGVHELWLCDLEERSIEQRVRDTADRLVTAGVFTGAHVLESAAFPGLRVTPDAVFAG